MAINAQDDRPANCIADDDEFNRVLDESMRRGFNQNLAAIKAFWQHPGSDIATIQSRHSVGTELDAMALLCQILKDKGKEMQGDSIWSIQYTDPPVVTFLTIPTGGQPQSPLLAIAKDVMRKLGPALGIRSTGTAASHASDLNPHEVSKAIDDILTILEGAVSTVASIEFPQQYTGKMLCLIADLDIAISSEKRAKQGERLVKLLENIMVANGKGKLIFFTKGDFMAIRGLRYPNNVVEIRKDD